MDIVKGSAVISKAGRDKGYFLAVVDVTEDGIYVCDGKERPLERPKKKNAKHLSATGYMLGESETATNRALKRALSNLKKPDEREVK